MEESRGRGWRQGEGGGGGVLVHCHPSTFILGTDLGAGTTRLVERWAGYPA